MKNCTAFHFSGLKMAQNLQILFLHCKPRRYGKITYFILITNTRSPYSLPNLDISVTNILYQNATNKSDANIIKFSNKIEIPPTEIFTDFSYQGCPNWLKMHTLLIRKFKKLAIQPHGSKWVMFQKKFFRAQRAKIFRFFCKRLGKPLEI